MRRQPLSDLRQFLRNEVKEAEQTFQGVFRYVGNSWSATPMVEGRSAMPPVIDRTRLKRIILTVIKVLIVLELLGALVQGANTHNWSRLGSDLLIAGTLYVLWDRITRITREKKELYRRRVEHAAGGKIRLWDALVFSLLWTDEIYADIPADRHHLVATAYTLIALGLVAAFTKIGEGFMSLIVAGALVLAAVNLLGWVVSRERVEKETLQTELRLARDVQLSLMPRQAPVLVGFDIAGLSLPAREVGGDHFDYVAMGENGMLQGLTVFDVSGKGMQAAMSAVFTSGAFVSEARRSRSPAEILTRLNRSVYRYSMRGHFVAFLCAVIDREERMLSFANAGQPKPVLWRSGTGTLLEASGVTFALGMTDNAVYTDRRVPLESGDVLLFLSDGLTEAMNPARETLGNEGLQGILSARVPAGASAGDLLGAVIRDVECYTSGAPQHDDITVVAVKVL